MPKEDTGNNAVVVKNLTKLFFHILSSSYSASVIDQRIQLFPLLIVTIDFNNIAVFDVNTYIFLLRPYFTPLVINNYLMLVEQLFSIEEETFNPADIRLASWNLKIHFFHAFRYIEEPE